MTRIRAMSFGVARSGHGQPVPLPANDNDRKRRVGGPLDSRGSAGASRLVRHYAALLENRRFADARRLWSDDGRASGLTEAEFVAAYDDYAVIRGDVGAPANGGVGTGAMVIDVPLTLSGTRKRGRPFTLAGAVTLRRTAAVDDVTGEERRWQIGRSRFAACP